MPRTNPVNAMTRFIRANPFENVGFAQSYAIAANCNSTTLHFKRRVLITYIYVLLIKYLREMGKLPNGQVANAPMSLQMNRTLAGGHQDAHQVLGEITVGGQHLYEISGLYPEVRRAIVYCNSAVSDLPAEYNMADGYIEDTGRRNYVALVQQVVSGTLTSNQAIYDRIVNIFADALILGRARLRADRNIGQQPWQGMDAILVTHGNDVPWLRNQSNLYGSKSMADFVLYINRNSTRRRNAFRFEL